MNCDQQQPKCYKLAKWGAFPLSLDIHSHDLRVSLSFSDISDMDRLEELGCILSRLFGVARCKPPMILKGQVQLLFKLLSGRTSPEEGGVEALPFLAPHNGLIHLATTYPTRGFARIANLDYRRTTVGDGVSRITGNTLQHAHGSDLPKSGRVKNPLWCNRPIQNELP